MKIKRSLYSLIKSSKKSILLIGPRQSGKSTLLKALKPELIINLANESDFIKISSDLDLFESLTKPYKFIFVDEVQRIPSLLNTIQKMIDDDGKVFLLSGSSVRKLKRGQANLLPGRVLSYAMAGFSLKELSYQFNAEKALAYGFLPEPYLEKNILSEKILETYSNSYLKEEIQAEALTRNLQGFMRFLNHMAEVSGSILDFTKLSTKAKVSRSSLVRFIEILEDTMVGQRVEVFQLAEKADTIKHPKFYFFDPGVLNGLLGNFVVSKDRRGNLFEHLVFSQLKNSATALDFKIEIFYFRTRNDVEVDFVIKLKNKWYAVEVKSGEVVRSDIAKLKIFSDYFPDVERCYVVSLKEKKRVLDGVVICGLCELLKDIGL